MEMSHPFPAQVMPAAGMAREYKCSALATYDDGDGAEQGGGGAPEKYLLAGTMEGDLLVMRLAAGGSGDGKLDTTRSGGVQTSGAPRLQLE